MVLQKIAIAACFVPRRCYFYSQATSFVNSISVQIIGFCLLVLALILEVADESRLQTPAPIRRTSYRLERSRNQDERQLPNLVIATNLNDAGHQIQIQALEVFFPCSWAKF